MNESKLPIDWELVEKHFRAGFLSLREICKEVGNTVTEGAIRKRAKRDGWSRDLSAKIQQKAAEKVRNELVREPSTQLTPTDERTVVEQMGTKVADVDLETRADIQMAFRTQKGLLEELAVLSDPKFADRLEALGEFMDESGPDSSGRWVKDKLNEDYRYIISLAGRVKMAKDIAGAYGVYAPMIRKMFGLDGEKEKASELDEILKTIHQKKAGK